MEVALALLCLFGLVMLVWSLMLQASLRAAERENEECLKISGVPAREIETLQKKAHALDLQLQLKRRKPPKKAPVDLGAVKLKLVSAIEEAFRGG